MAKLTEKQKRFAEEYLVDLNATQAAIRAGYSKKTGGQIGEQNLKKLEIKKYIQGLMRDREKRTEITQDEVLREWAKMAFFDPRKLFHDDGKPKDITELDDDTAACLSGLDVQEQYEYIGGEREFVGYVKKYKLIDKRATLDSVARHLGMFTDNINVKGTVNNPAANLTEEELRRLAGMGNDNK